MFVLQVGNIYRGNVDVVSNGINFAKLVRAKATGIEDVAHKWAENRANFLDIFAVLCSPFQTRNFRTSDGPDKFI